jgi:hypothetical protein
MNIDFFVMLSVIQFPEIETPFESAVLRQMRLTSESCIGFLD